MQKPYLLDLIQRVRDLTGIALPIIVGSHSLFAATDDVPSIVRQSLEVDFLFGQEGAELRQRVNAELGITSNFYDLHGYFADALGLATVVLVPGWQDRLRPLADETGTIVAQCLELHDVAISKLMAFDVCRTATHELRGELRLHAETGEVIAWLPLALPSNLAIS